MYVDTGQGTARWLDNPVDFSLGDAVPRHRLDSFIAS